MKSARKCILLGIILFVALSLVPVHSHPHMFIDTKVVFSFGPEELKGFWIEWYFDVMFTASIRLDYDYDGNGQFDADEVEDIEQNAFCNLRNFNYFTRVIQDGTVEEITDVSDFDAWMEDGQLVYRFFIPYSSQLTAEKRELSVIIFDDTFWCDIMYTEEEPVRFAGAADAVTEAKIQANRDYIIEYDPTGGQSRGQSGSAAPSVGQAFPYELQLSYRKK